MRGATADGVVLRVLLVVSIHAPHAGRDAVRYKSTYRLESFNPRAPCGARQGAKRSTSHCHRFQSTRPMRGATHYTSCKFYQNSVSIHAPRTGRDRCRAAGSVPASSFNPRAPCGARQRLPAVSRHPLGFQSTRPVWGATDRGACDCMARQGFNPRAPCGARLFHIVYLFIHTRFNPRAPCGARHSARLPQCPLQCFNPRAPCGARPIGCPTVSTMPTFQSTRPVWGATHGDLWLYARARVSIHAPRVGRDNICMLCIAERTVSIHAPRVGRDGGFFMPSIPPRGFNPRAPCGARPWGYIQCLRYLVSIHAPRVGRDTRYIRPIPNRKGFNPRAPCGARPAATLAPVLSPAFQSTRPVWGATT